MSTSSVGWGVGSMAAKSDTDGERSGQQTDNRTDWHTYRDGLADQLILAETGRQQDKHTGRQVGTERKRVERRKEIEAGPKSSQMHSSHWRSSTLSKSDKFKRIWQSFHFSSFHLPIGFLLTGRISDTNRNISVFDNWVTGGEARGLFSLQSRTAPSSYPCNLQKQSCFRLANRKTPQALWPHHHQKEEWVKNKDLYFLIPKFSSFSP